MQDQIILSNGVAIPYISTPATAFTTVYKNGIPNSAIKFSFKGGEAISEKETVNFNSLQTNFSKPENLKNITVKCNVANADGVAELKEVGLYSNYTKLESILFDSSTSTFAVTVYQENEVDLLKAKLAEQQATTDTLLLDSLGGTK